MKRFSKMIGAGMGSALATVIVFAIKQAGVEIDPATEDSIKFIIYTVLSMGGAYVAPPNAQ